MKKIHSVIDPWSLGLVIAILGSTTTYILYDSSHEQAVKSDTVLEQAVLNAKEPEEVKQHTDM